MGIHWSPEMREAALGLRADGMSFDRIAVALGCSRTKVKNELVPGNREYHRYASIMTRARRAEGQPCRRYVITAEPVEPKNPAFDPKRDGWREPSDLTGRLLGDPFPGRNEFMRRAG